MPSRSDAKKLEISRKMTFCKKKTKRTRKMLQDDFCDFRWFVTDSDGFNRSTHAISWFFNALCRKSKDSEPDFVQNQGFLCKVIFFWKLFAQWSQICFLMENYHFQYELGCSALKYFSDQNSGNFQIFWPISWLDMLTFEVESKNPLNTCIPKQ